MMMKKLCAWAMLVVFTAMMFCMPAAFAEENADAEGETASIIFGSTGTAGSGTSDSGTDSNTLPEGTTPSATASPAPTNANSTAPRYGKTNKKGVNLRKRANTKSTLFLQINNTGTYVLILEEVEGKDKKPWYSVRCDGKKGYIRADLIDEIMPNDAEYQEAAKGFSTGKTSGTPATNGSSTNSSSGSGSSITLGSSGTDE